MSGPTTVVKQIDVITSFEALLAGTEPEAADLTRLDVYELPRTKGLQERYAITMSGPAARQLAQFVYGQAEHVFALCKKAPE